MSPDSSDPRVLFPSLCDAYLPEPLRPFLSLFSHLALRASFSTARKLAEAAQEDEETNSDI